MDIACFRWSCELVSGRAEVASTGAEDLVLGVVCVGGGRGKVPRIRGKMVHFPPEKRTEMAVKSTFPAGKCHRFVAKRFTFPGKTEKRRKFPINSKSFLVPHNKKIPLFPA